MAATIMFSAMILVLASCSAIVGSLSSNQLREPESDAAHLLRSPWTWRCSNNLCQRHALEDRETPLSASTCKLTCGPDANLWPRPRSVSVDPRLQPVNANAMSLEFVDADGNNIDSQRAGGSIIEKVADRWRQQQEEKASGPDGSSLVKDGGRSVEVRTVLRQPDVADLTLDTPEGYELSVAKEGDQLKVHIHADNVFGARNALETLHQLIVRDPLRRELLMPVQASIKDEPAYKYRGILLDTARSFVTVEAIKRTLDAMAASKLNTFHWHITDSHSFPFVSETFPKLSQYGAFSPEEVYTPEQIRDLVEYARVRGVRLVPELDAPAHVGEGWQWVGPEGEATVCFRAEPWTSYCVEPPCGQLNPTVERVYDILAGIYKDMLAAFRPSMFHMGGDEVNFNCWNSTESIVRWLNQNNGSARTSDDFRMLWDVFQKRALGKLVEANGGKEMPVVLWTSGLTAPGKVDLYLDPKKYIIQIWTLGSDSLIKELAEKGYRLIMSNYDALYFDCGFGAWVGEGNNWCSPYIGWQKVYNNDPRALLRNQGITEQRLLDNVLGAEATLWTEQADSSSVDGRLWPRAAAMAERLWTGEDQWTWRDAEQRMLEHRNRLVKLGVQADRLEPQWCDQNPGLCH